MCTKSVAGRWLPVAALTVVLGWAGLTWAQQPPPAEKKPEPPKPKDVVDVAKETANLKTFASLVEKAGLVETLKGKGPFTIFAPTDDAFKKLGAELDNLQKPENKAKLAALLKGHVIDGKKLAAGLKDLKTAKSLAGNDLKIEYKDGATLIGTAKVAKADTDAANGVIHTIDAVLPAPPEKKP
jgi:uncharacterized surface protein with fasciclin (FAS1) repeats